MSWIRNLIQTYDLCKDIVGISREDEDQSSMLLPLGHSLSELNIVIYLRENGSIFDAKKKDEKTLICIPCTEESESRSSTGAIDSPHPLFDDIKYLLTDNYLNNLKDWLDYLQNKREFSISYRALYAVYQYIKDKTLLQDLETRSIPKKDMFVAFAVNLDGISENRLWRIPNLFNAWKDYYLNKLNSNNNKAICYVTGREDNYTEKHPKKINRLAGNAKLISGNDKENFTFRGRFDKASQALTVSYEASQKVHQMLRWLIKNSSFRCDSQAITVWAIDSKTNVLPFNKNSRFLFYSLNNLRETNEEKLSSVEANILFIDFSKKFINALRGYNTINKLKKHKRRVAILATDVSTTGRLAVTYYRECGEDEFEERLEQWHNVCKWYQPYENGKGYFIGAPSYDQIAIAVLGKPRSQNEIVKKASKREQKDEAYEKLKKNLNEQLLHCMFDGYKLPLPLVSASVNRVSNPQAFENSEKRSYLERWQEWEKVLCTACALIKKFYYDHGEEDFKVELETSKRDRNYLYGRLLAIADQIESYARFKRGKDTADLGATNALRYMSAFSQHPFRTWNLLFTQQLNPYIQQLNGADRYLYLIGTIKELFKPGDYESDAPLDGRYLLGFFAQRQHFIKESMKKLKGGEKNESEQQD